ncbi:Glycosyltransferase involved in cell wall bisynthesis [Algoriella xinjiangensis]|uniref:Glycosyltransferase involved in cell wall bisynthesis n=1 Tax=Algoriella xinjiangensis TaxID=684065 RepID=A0A1I4VFG5_9FLAO|nr:glycosyltransferase family 2 protein [Algoriella xinjiangensis]SFM99932.1 Glycosyltransferase involved in cell wall bisynthesis [Algoriella xinjiangensis]
MILQKKDKRFNYFYKENGGVSSARNLGLEKATGKFIVFVDSDDWVEENYLKDFVDNYKNDTTLIIQDLTKEINGQIKINRLGFFVNKEYNFINDFEEIIKNSHILEGFPVNKFFVKDTITENKIKFKENITHKEDEIFCLEYYKTISNIKILNVSNYHYVNRENSATSSHPSFESEFEYLKNYILNIDFMRLRVDETTLLIFKKDQLKFKFNYLIYNILYLKVKDRANRVLNLKKIYDEFISNYEMINKTFIQKVDFFLFRFKLFYILDAFIKLRK